MKDTTLLHGSHLHTYEKLFQHPLSHNLEWHDVETMLAKLCQLTVADNGHVSLARNGHTIVLHRPKKKELTDHHELKQIRQFLERSEAEVPSATSDRALVVMSHHEARVFHSDEPGSRARTITSHDPRYLRHEDGSKDFSRGKEKPAPSSFFEPLAEALKGANTILLFGRGAGHASEMGVFEAWLTKHHPDVAGRIVGSVVVDENQMSDAELLAQARAFYPQPAAKS